MSPQEEAVPENLKNVLLFMSSSGYLVPPSKDPAQEKLWSETWRRIDRFLPDLRADLQLEEEVPEKGEGGEKEKEKRSDVPGRGAKVFGVAWDAAWGIVSGGEDRQVQINRGRDLLER